MRVLIVGAGAMGLLVGGLIDQTSGVVSYLTRTDAQAKVLNKMHVLVQSPVVSPTSFSVRAYPFIESRKLSTNSYPQDEFNAFDMVIVTIKQYQLDAVLPWIKKVIVSTIPLLFLMNGLGHQEKVKRALNKHDVFFGITQWGAVKINEHSVQERGRGVTKVGQYQSQLSSSKSPPKTMIAVLTRLCALGVDISCSENIDIDLWKKCIANACINPLSAIHGVRNGLLIENTNLYDRMHELYQEAAMLVSKTQPSNKAVILGYEDELWNEIVHICEQTSNNRSSMLQDIQQGRQTEIEAITGYLLAQAKMNHIDMPNHQLIYDSIGEN